MSHRDYFRELAAHILFALDLGPACPENIIDNELLAFAKNRHRVAALLHISVNKGSQVEGKATADKLNNINCQGSKFLLQRKASEMRIMRHFSDSNIRAVEIKGTGLAEQLYPYPEARYAKDIDILIAPESVPKAMSLLNDRSYRFEKNQSAPIQKLYMDVVKDITFYDPKFGTQIELHQRLFLAEPDGFTSHFLQSLKTGQEAGIRNNFYVLYLIMHGAISSWPRLKWAIDILLLLQKTDGQAADVFHLAQQFHCSSALVGSLNMIAEIFPGTMPVAWQKEICSSNNNLKSKKLEAAFMRMIQREKPVARKIGFPFADRYIWDGGIRSIPYIKRRLLRPFLLRM